MGLEGGGTAAHRAAQGLSTIWGGFATLEAGIPGQQAPTHGAQVACARLRRLHAAPPATCPTPRRPPPCSDATHNSSASRLSQLQAESPQANKIFGNVGLPPEAEPVAAAAAESAGAAAGADALESSVAGRLVSAIGNTLFFGSMAAASFFGWGAGTRGGGCWRQGLCSRTTLRS